MNKTLKRKVLRKFALKYWEFGMNNSYLEYFEEQLEKDIDKLVERL